MAKNTRKSGIFLSYSRQDDNKAAALERALTETDVPVWRDVRSIQPGAAWAPAIEQAIREASGVVVLITDETVDSEWVKYEYAFARGAQIPVVAVVAGRAAPPPPLQGYQSIPYSKRSAAKIKQWMNKQARVAAAARVSLPTLVASFQEENGKLVRASSGKTPSYSLSMWVQNAPPQTRRVEFEITDLGFTDRIWAVARGRQSMREFLTDEDFNSWGDIEILARGKGVGSGNWRTSTRLYEALMRYYKQQDKNQEIRRALDQIRTR